MEGAGCVGPLCEFLGVEEPRGSFRELMIVSGFWG